MSALPPWRELFEMARRCAGLPGFLRHPPAIEAAARAVAARVRQREAMFLDTAERLIYGVESSPLRRLIPALYPSDQASL